MKLNLDGVDYQFQRNENNELVVTLVNGVLWGKVTSLPELTKKELREVFVDYIDMRICLCNLEVSYTDLMNLYERRRNCDVVLNKKTLVVFFKTEIVAVLANVNDLTFVEMDMRLRLIFYYFSINKFKPYFVDYKELLKYGNDIF
jgi:hypothetical protein